MNKFACMITMFSFCISPCNLFAQSVDFGRMFNTPEQRHQLDLIRSQIYSGRTVETELDSKSVEKSSRAIVVSGILKRENGKAVIWIDGKSEISLEGRRKDIKVALPAYTGNKAAVEFDHKVQWLKPGQIWNTDKNQVHEAYEATKLKNETLKQENATTIPTNAVDNPLQTDQQKQSLP